MHGQELIEAIKKSDLKGRGGAGFDTALKWQMVADARSDKKYVICNAMEGEPESQKDFHIIKHYFDEVINGMILAMHTVGATEAIIFMHKEKYNTFSAKINRQIHHLPIKLLSAPNEYRCGEETTLLNAIEGLRTEPRNKPPYPTDHGLYGYPTLINNVETLWAISKISKGEYKKTRFYTILGKVSHPGVYEANEDISIDELLKQTQNRPKETTFAQIGGGASGKMILNKSYNQSILGLGAITLHTLPEIPQLLKRFAKFFQCESCGLCVPCREGTYRIYEEIQTSKPDWQKINEILSVLEQTSFCALGRSAAVPFKTIEENNLINS